jgi:hypothetical protein
MWIRKQPDEVISDRRASLQRSVCWIGLLFTAYCIIIMRFGPLLGSSFQDWNIAFLVLGLVAVSTLVWRSTRQERESRNNTAVCDRCNAVKLADGATTCKCGGHYLSMDEMKWISKPDASSQQTMKVARGLA